MRLISEDENWKYYEGEVELDGREYTVKYTVCKMNLKTNLPEHLSKQRIRWSNASENSSGIKTHGIQDTEEP